MGDWVLRGCVLEGGVGPTSWIESKEVLFRKRVMSGRLPNLQSWRSITFSHGHDIAMTGYCCTVRFCCKRPINQHLTPADVLAYLGFGKEGPWQARRARAYNGGLGAEPPAESRSRAPGRKPPWSWNTFCFWRFNAFEGSTYSYKVACKKFSWSGQRGGHRTMPPLNTPLVAACAVSAMTSLLLWIITYAERRNDGNTDRTTNLLISSNVHYVHLGGDDDTEVI